MSRIGTRLRHLFHELRHRGVLQVLSVYAVSAWGVVNGAVQMVPMFDAPVWTVDALLVVAIVGFPIAGVLAWLFDFPSMNLSRSRLLSTPHSAPVATKQIREHGVVRATWRDANGREFERLLDRPFSIGRDSTSSIYLDDPLVSRRHVEVGVADGRWYVADLGSRNGTLLDGKKIAREPLPPRCVLRLADEGPQVQLELRAAGVTTALAPNR